MFHLLRGTPRETYYRAQSRIRIHVRAILKFAKIMMAIPALSRTDDSADQRIASKLSSVDTFSGRYYCAVEPIAFIVCTNCSGFPVTEGTPTERNNYRCRVYLQRRQGPMRFNRNAISRRAFSSISRVFELLGGV